MLCEKVKRSLQKISRLYSLSSKMQLLQKSDDVFAQAAKKYGRTMKSLEEDVDVLVEWLKKQLHLPELMDRRSIRNFLITNKCSIERTKGKIDFYYTIKSRLPDIFDISNPKRKNMQDVMGTGYFVPLPKQFQGLTRVFLVTAKQGIDPKDFDLISCIALANVVEEVRLLEDCMSDDFLIVDLYFVTFDFLLRLTPSIILKMLACYQKVYSMPVKGIYLINSPPYINYLLNIVKGIVKPKIFARIEVFNDDSILLKTFPKEIIPKDYGGEEKSLDELGELWRLKFEEHSKRFDKLDGLRVDESLRPPEMKNDDFLGVHGNFKKLNVD